VKLKKLFFTVYFKFTDKFVRKFNILFINARILNDIVICTVYYTGWFKSIHPVSKCMFNVKIKIQEWNELVIANS